MLATVIRFAISSQGFGRVGVAWRARKVLAQPQPYFRPAVPSNSLDNIPHNAGNRVRIGTPLLNPPPPLNLLPPQLTPHLSVYTSSRKPPLPPPSASSPTVSQNGTNRFPSAAGQSSTVCCARTLLHSPPHRLHQPPHSNPRSPHRRNNTSSCNGWTSPTTH